MKCHLTWGNAIYAHSAITPFLGFGAGSERFCFVSRLQVWGKESKTAHTLQGGAITQIDPAQKKGNVFFQTIT